ncbi:MAG TPA: protein-export chaperone SecB [Parafilimonas sp.]|nr:protein-export chaperone SecB [Parafilimonas sp.]
MAKTQELDNNYHLLRVILLKEAFEREEKISFKEGIIGTDIKLSNKKTKINKDKIFSITSNLELTASQETKDNVTKQVFKLPVSFRGHFEVAGTPELPLEEFCEVNAPAIIFPSYVNMLQV